MIKLQNILQEIQDDIYDPSPWNNPELFQVYNQISNDIYGRDFDSLSPSDKQTIRDHVKQESETEFDATGIKDTP